MHRSDLESVLRLEQDLFPADAWSSQMFLDELTEPTRSYLVAETCSNRPELVGFAGLRVVPPEGDIQTMAVDRRYWSQGIGARLLTALLDIGAQQGVTETFLEVRTDNPRAQDLYRRFGFVELGMRPGYYAGADAVVMRRSASNPHEEDPRD
ncbi:ribosomal protein S18-alanine N-acetyltransferase [Lipingzhangella sp. LS1_29]|uniref:[Ribosomal protein bS18]-alanine N-acetyltransferase n=2 Tax=Lipingzhangella rawalii TaxID=2055835 RepID=A0ABU2H3W3_9ACTN|nr:ribosomal protein S18-alanine N-acetyltransferase [Lipingzhangella rawalii]MDS1269992.1 ribosomal protein S18-alanine N-acetyltransferase [Lipingzhangella rawalii]